MRHVEYPYVTVGSTPSQPNVRPYMPDMSWLGEAPTEKYSRRYESVRLGRIAAAQCLEISMLDAEERQLMLDISASESPVRRKALVARLQNVQQQIAELKAQHQ